MSRSSNLSPRREHGDLSRLEGIEVLDEPLTVLFSALLRLQFGKAKGGTVPVSATVTTEEGLALARAMQRSEEDDPRDTRTRGQRDCDRFMSVVQQVADAVAAAHGTEPPWFGPRDRRRR